MIRVEELRDRSKAIDVIRRRLEVDASRIVTRGHGKCTYCTQAETSFPAARAIRPVVYGWEEATF